MENIEWGSVADWFSGIATLAAIVLTIVYNKIDNSPRIYTRLLSEIKTKKNDFECTSQGYTLEVINAGKVQTRVKFEGLVSGYTRVEKLNRNILYWLSKYSRKAWNCYQLKTHEPQIPSLEYFDNTEYILLSPFENTVSIPIKPDELKFMIINCFKISHSQQKQVKKNEELIFQFVVNDFTGKEYTKSIVLRPKEDTYIDLKEYLMVYSDS